MTGTVEDRAMVHEWQTRVPGSADAARAFAVMGFRPAFPERFPWRCPESYTVVQPYTDGERRHDVRCVLVEGHMSAHAGEVEW